MASGKARQSVPLPLTHYRSLLVTCFLLLVTCSLLLDLSACGTMSRQAEGTYGGEDGAPEHPPDFASLSEPAPRLEPLSKYGNPPFYEVDGKVYHTLSSGAGYVERGIASWYGTKFHKRRTSSGEPYDLYALTAAHKTLPIPCYAEVTNLSTGRKLIVRINDRGPFLSNRLIDLSYAAAARLGILSTGTALVEVRAIDPRIPTAPTLLAEASPTPQTTPLVVTKPLAPPAGRRTVLSSAASLPRAVPAGLFLQVGAFQSRDNAERLRQRLRDSAITATQIVQASLKQTVLYRVRIGPLASIAEADRLTESIARLGIGSPQVVVD